MRIPCVPLMPACLAAAISTAPAATLAKYTFDTVTNNTPVAATTTDSRATVSTIDANVPFTSTTTASPGSGRAITITMSNIDDDFATPHYYEFTLTPAAPGQALQLTNLTFAFNVSAAGAANVSSYQLRYNDLSGTAGFITVGTTAEATGTTPVQANFDLSGIAFSNLTAGITFRLDVKDSGSTASNASVRLDDLTVNGEVIPEPSSAALLLGAAGAFLLRRRR